MASVIGLIYTIGQNLMDRYYDVNEYNNELIRFQMWCYSICNIGSAGVWDTQNKTNQSSIWRYFFTMGMCFLGAQFFRMVCSSSCTCQWSYLPFWVHLK